MVSTIPQWMSKPWIFSERAQRFLADGFKALGKGRIHTLVDHELATREGRDSTHNKAARVQFNGFEQGSHLLVVLQDERAHGQPPPMLSVIWMLQNDQDASRFRSTAWRHEMHYGWPLRANFSWPALLSRLLSWLSADNIRAMSAAHGISLIRTGADTFSVPPSLLRAEFSRYPVPGAAWWSQLLTTQLSLSIHGEITRCALEITVDRDGLSEHYPALSRYLQKLGRLLKLKTAGVYRLPDGRTLMRSSFNGEAMLTRLEWQVHGSQLQPMDGDSRAAGLPVTLDNINGSSIVGSVDWQLRGLAFILRDVVLVHTIELSPAYTLNQLRLSAVGSHSIRGALFGMVPWKMLDIGMGGAPSELLDQSIAAMLAAHQGKGTAVVWRTETQPGQRWHVWSIQSATPRHLFYEWGLAYLNEMISIPADTVNDLSRLIHDVRQAVLR